MRSRVWRDRSRDTRASDCLSSLMSGSMFSHSAWHKKRFAENAEYREKIRAAWRRYRETHKDAINERRRLRRRTDSAFRDKDRASKREWERRKRYREVYRISEANYDAMRMRQ